MTKRGPEYARQRNEKYFTPAWVTEALLDRERFHGTSWDPAAGAGHIVDVFCGPGLSYMAGSDLEPDADHIKQGDFLADKAGLYSHFLGVENVVTNPPFGVGGRLAVTFIERALSITQEHAGKVAMLLPLAFDSAKGRKHIFADCPQFAGKYILTKRIRWANLEQKAAGPMENHQWCIWDHRRDPKADPFVRYI